MALDYYMANRRPNNTAALASQIVQNFLASKREGDRRQDMFALEDMREKSAMERTRFTQESYLNRLGKMEEARDKNALAKHYRQYGITKGANEGDDEFEVRAQKELKARAESELGALRGHIDTITAKRNSLAAQAETKLTGEIETAARSAAAAMLKPEEAAILLSKGPGAFANRPEVLDLYNKAKAELLKNAQVPLGIQAELGQLTDELRSSRALYDDAIKSYRNMGGGLSSLFPKTEAAAPPAGAPQGLTLPPPPGGGASLLGAEQPQTKTPATKREFPGLIPLGSQALGAVPEAYGQFLNAVTYPARTAIQNYPTLLTGGEFMAPPALPTSDELIGRALNILRSRNATNGPVEHKVMPSQVPGAGFPLGIFDLMPPRTQ